MNIVIVEDDINMRKSLEIALGEYEELNIKSYKSAVEALKKLSDDTDLIITDINMPKMDGLEFIKELNGKFDVIIMTGNATLNKAIESVRLGVKDFLTKPFDVSTLYEAVKRVEALKQKTPKSIKKVETKSENNGFLATSKALEATLNIALKAARTDASVMLSGESGVGKEVFAKFIHANSPRKDAAFIALNMAAIPENLIESELFGFEKGAFTDAATTKKGQFELANGKEVFAKFIHANSPRKDAAFIALNMAAIPENLIESELFGFEKGAFTDAATTKKGQFELANGGTLFLDEIGEMPINLQPKLLRALQEREITRLGAIKSEKIDVRIICATNANLELAMKEGRFREDLFYRLNTIPLFIPPLRERKDEILPIAQDALDKCCKEYGFEPKNFSKAAKEELLGYDYPGNIRELISVVQRAAILSEGDEILPKDLFLQARSKK